jgi:hypothetical protein
LLEYGSGYELSVVNIGEQAGAETFGQSLYFRVWRGRVLRVLGNVPARFPGTPNFEDALWARALENYPLVEHVSYPLPIRDRQAFLRALSKGSDVFSAMRDTQSYKRLRRLGFSLIRRVWLKETDAGLEDPNIDDTVVAIRVFVDKDAPSIAQVEGEP